MKKTLVLCSLLLGACGTNPHKAAELDTKIDKTQTVTEDSVIGVKDGNMIYQKKVLLGEELRSATVTARELEAKLYGGPRYYDNNGLIGSLRACRSKVASRTGEKLQWTEKRDYVIPDEEEIKMGVDEKGKLMGITEEYLKDRLVRYQGYQKILRQRTDEMEEKLAACNAHLEILEKKKSISGE